MQKHQVRLLRLNDDNDELVRALRLIGRIDLKHAHDIAMHLKQTPRCVVVAGIDLDVADYIAQVLNTAGCDANVEPSAIDSPMLCTPDANVMYEWGALRTVRPRKAS